MGVLHFRRFVHRLHTCVMVFPLIHPQRYELMPWKVLHFGQAIHRRAWFLLPTAVLAGIGEMIGWGGRLWSSYEPLADDPYMMQ